MGGPTGLEYASLYPLIDRVAKNPDEWDELFGDIQVLEIAALNAMHEKN